MKLYQNIIIRNISFILRQRRFWKSILSGTITAGVDLSLLFFLHEILHWSSLSAVNASFVVAILVNFSLQKFWTFSNKDLDIAHKQFAKFFIVAMGNMAMNSFIMLLFITVFGLWYLGAQIITMGILAIMNFTLYRNFVFK